MNNGDEQLLASIPEYLSIGAMLKATPVTEGGERFVYFEASNQGLDQTNEIVAAKALKDSSDYFLRYGNIDIDHYTMLGAKSGIPDYPLYEIGRPIDVRQHGEKTFVKAQIYSGEGSAARRANDFWSSLVDISPPQRWYPSVGGAVLEKSVEVDPKTKSRMAVISKVRWSNIGVSKTPVNQHVPSCATVPVGAFAKSLTASGALNLSKALEMGHSTDSASMSGGAAMQKESLFGSNSYLSCREAVSAAIRDGKIKPASAKSIASFAKKKFGFSADEAAEFTERLLGDIARDLRNRK
jgi:hypothetical protein